MCRDYLKLSVIWHHLYYWNISHTSSQKVVSIREGSGSNLTPKAYTKVSRGRRLIWLRKCVPSLLWKPGTDHVKARRSVFFLLVAATPVLLLFLLFAAEIFFSGKAWFKMVTALGSLQKIGMWDRRKSLGFTILSRRWVRKHSKSYLIIVPWLIHIYL